MGTLRIFETKLAGQARRWEIRDVPISGARAIAGLLSLT
jgi:hypothetical protein